MSSLRHVTPRRLVPALAVASLVVGACGSSDDDVDSVGSDGTTTTSPTSTTVAAAGGDESTTTAVPTTEAPATDPPATEAPATDPPATEAPATDPPATDPPTDGTCLVGAWAITEDELNAYYDAVEADSGGGFDITIAGQTLLTFTEDTYLYEPDFDLTLSVAGQEGTGDTTGSVSGSYVAVDGVITTTLQEGALDIQVTVGGVTVDGSSLGNDFLTSVPINDAPFDCSGPSLGFLVGDGDERHPVTLTPA